jgi:hypothetical protein
VIAVGGVGTGSGSAYCTARVGGQEEEGTRVNETTEQRCACGVALRAWRTEEGAARVTEVWAVDLADLVAYQARRPTRHDIRDRRGRRLQRGQCGGPPP